MRGIFGCARRDRGKRVDHLARTSVVKLLAGLMFDRVGIVLKPLNMPFQHLVLMTETLQLLIEHLLVIQLPLISGQAVLPKDDVISKSDSKRRSRDRRPAPPAADHVKQRAHRKAALFRCCVIGARPSHP